MTARRKSSYEAAVHKNLFAVAAKIPRNYCEDPDYFPECVHVIYEWELEKAGGVRLSGPLRLRFLEFGYWDIDGNGEWVPESNSWLVAIVLLTGPAVIRES